MDHFQHDRSVSDKLHDQGALRGEEMVRLLDSMNDKDAGLFRRMFTNGLFELMGTDRAFEFGLKVILLGIEQVIMEQEK